MNKCSCLVPLQIRGVITPWCQVPHVLKWAWVKSHTYSYVTSLSQWCISLLDWLEYIQFFLRSFCFYRSVRDKPGQTSAVPTTRRYTQCWVSQDRSFLHRGGNVFIRKPCSVMTMRKKHSCDMLWPMSQMGKAWIIYWCLFRSRLVIIHHPIAQQLYILSLSVPGWRVHVIFNEAV